MKKRARGKAFPKGRSGNPGGRPKLTPEEIELRAYARTFSKESIDALVKMGIRNIQPSSARVSAINAILDRGHGKATMPIEVEATVEVKGVTVRIAGMADSE